MSFDGGTDTNRRTYVGSAEQVGFIVGTGRCGTTILAQVLNAHSRICVPPEMQFAVSIGNGDRLWDKFENGELARYGAADLTALFDRCCPYDFEKFFAYEDHFAGLDYPQTDPATILQELYDHICSAHGKEVFLEQTPWQGQKLSTLKRLFPGLKVVHMVRDARDVALSFARTPWWSDDLGENLRQWAREVRVIHDFGLSHPDSLLTVRYEDLVTDPPSWIGRILNLFDLSFEDRMLDPANLIDYASMFAGQADQVVSREFKAWDAARRDVFFKESTYAWRRDPEADFLHVAQEVAATLQMFGYGDAART